ncbi:aldose epimerase family protein [Wenyingzhuangia sp. IMCC45533]
MYTVKKSQSNGLSYLEVASSNGISVAKICLNRGAALEALKLKGETLIKDLAPLTYENTYASSILFPFANRIKDGKYNYKGQEFQLECNEGNLNNALHGLLHHKNFELISEELTANQAEVTLSYTETELAHGFPYLYSVQVKYTLTANSLDLEFGVKNEDDKSFPFTLGWHPYFLSGDLSKSSLEFESTKTVAFDERMITKNVIEGEVAMPFEIKDQELDNCYALQSGTVMFNTPNYKMEINSTAKENFFQMYTPPVANTIALEPVTGISDSFNNQMGLQELEPNATEKIVWTVKL